MPVPGPGTAAGRGARTARSSLCQVSNSSVCFPLFRNSRLKHTLSYEEKKKKNKLNVPLPAKKRLV